ncbi:MAG: hypothetical protein M0Z34_01365 [Nitrospiraceae bacterium]|nr:hypothetical protein [Nitrospiraceae bacterium]MDA8208660.1 hypothetical protein [Actinomycetota bacterium]
MATRAELSRAFYQAYEPVHSAIYFVHAAQDAYADVGLKPGWMGYFASRSAPMGRVGAEVVAATFYSFAPGLVARSIPLAWELATPEQVTEARLTAVGAMMATALTDEDASGLQRLCSALESVATTLPIAGHPLFGGHLSVNLVDDPAVRLWQILTLFREHRGDTHMALLAGNNLNSMEANIVHHLDGRASKEFLTRSRGYREEDWAAGAADLASRGLVTTDGTALTAAGVNLKARIEAATDELSAHAVDALGQGGLHEVMRELGAISDAVRNAHPLPI